ncbi:MAG TPA: methyl-accepting chemotaxis protein [Candidatus Sulfotelmatobacter sp.]|jgi:methyl-accepting chemotaxis protein|nr:methyl-accepting chemotaxis protein [Candidatus Sulfotelmatobacter sp.]
MTFTVARKIWCNLLIGLVGLAVIYLFTHFGIATLRQLQDEGAGRYNAAGRSVEASLMGVLAYDVIADAIINRHLDDTRKDWIETRAKLEKIAKDMAALADTPQKRDWTDKGAAATARLIQIFEKTLMPVLESPDADSQWERIREIDDQMDEQKKIIADAYGKLAEALTAEANKADAVFDETGTRINVDATLVVVVTALLTLVMGILLIRSVLGPVNQTIGNMERLAEDDLDIDIRGVDRKDELGAMARALLVFKENAVQKRRVEAEAEAGKRQAEDQRRAAMLNMADGFEGRVSGVVQGVSSSAREMESAAQNMSGLAAQVSAQAQVVAQASDEAAQNVSTVAAATEELSSSVREISRQVAESARISQEAVAEAGQTDAIVRGLAETVSKIGDVANLINDIATQTNLLALNATIEAARAGDAGKGFAVVANEVKHLANQTGKATEEISGQIAAVQAETQRATQAISSIADTITRIDQITGNISAAVEQQSAATQEIASNVERAARGTHDVTDTISGVTQAADSSSAAAQTVLASARRLHGDSETMQQAIADFVATIRRG